MPIHDWTRVTAGTFHDFHQSWIVRIKDALNTGVLPPGYYAMADQKVRGPEGDTEPDVLTLRSARPSAPGRADPGVAVADAPLRTRRFAQLDPDRAAYARKANRLSVRLQDGRVVAVIEIVSPGNKDGSEHFDAFARKVIEFLSRGIHVAVVDLFPPTPRDPDGIDWAIWERLGGSPFDPRPPGKVLTAVSFDAGDSLSAHSDPLAVGDPLPDMPLFLSAGRYVSLPLEATYSAAWAVLPQIIRDEVAPPAA